MRGSGIWFAHEIQDPEQFDLLLVTDMIALADLKALWGAKCPPSILYFHENQLSYPLPEGERMDYQFGFTTITSAMAADAIVFNTHFHLDSFFTDLPRFIQKMPEHRPAWVTEILREKARVLYPGCRFQTVKTRQRRPDGTVPVIVWNHRWEYDKDPDTFFRSLSAVDDMGLSFNLVLIGENFQAVPKPFLSAKERYGERIFQYGYVKSREAYYSSLAASDIIISTAKQENFGISVIEAIRHGCYPVLPRRLSYPEILPKRFHDSCLYESTEDLVQKLEHLLRERRYPRRSELTKAMAKYAWNHVVGEYDAMFDSLII